MVLFRRKKKPVQGPEIEPGFRPCDGLFYLDFLGGLHVGRKPDWYLEVGTQKGLSLARATGRAIAIDPMFQIKVDAFKALPELHMFQATSDDFFAGDFLARNGIRVDLAFLDGMHLFEFLLRDFMNTEKAASSGGVITMHDCVPLNTRMENRHWDKEVTKEWTGDVWKLLPILRKYRPDLQVDLVDCAPTGLVVVTGLDPANEALDHAYDQILADWTDLRLADYGIDRFATEFPLVPAAQAAQSLTLVKGST